MSERSIKRGRFAVRKGLARRFHMSAFMLVLGDVIILNGCGSNQTQGTGQMPGATIASGSAQAGEAIFATSCVTCHTTTTERAVGPGLAGLFDPGGPELPNNVDYDGNLPNGRPITEANVAAWITSGGRGEIGFMPGQRFTPQQMSDLIAYLRPLHK